MKNILIVTYYYEPYNLIATRRPVSWANYLSLNNKVTVLTRSWTGNEDGINDSIIDNLTGSVENPNSNLEIIKLPYINKSNPPVPPSSFLNKLIGLYKWYFGKFTDIPSIKENFEEEIYKVIETRKIDLIIYSCNPYEFLYVSKRVFKKTGIKYIIDFRDLISNSMLKKKVPFLVKLYKVIMKVRLHFVLKTAAATVTVSDPIRNIIRRFSNSPAFTIYNGYNQQTFEKYMNDTEDDQVFQITYTGNIHPDTNLVPLLEGIALFFESLRPNAQLNFIGARKEDLEIVNKFKTRINLNVIKWMPYEEALKFSRRSSVFLSIGYPGYSGILSGKIFDYLGLQRTIVLAPSNEDALENLIRYTNSGYVANTALEVKEIFEGVYKDWEMNGRVNYKGDIQKLQEFTRENQAKKLEQIIDTLT